MYRYFRTGQNQGIKKAVQIEQLFLVLVEIYFFTNFCTKSFPDVVFTLIT